MSAPILKGGQGRSPRDVRETAEAVTFFLILGVGSLLLLAIGSVCYFAR